MNSIYIVCDSSRYKFFLEYIECIQHYANRLFNRPCRCVFYNHDFRTQKNVIYIAVQTIPPCLLSLKNIVLLQTEQCSRQNIIKQLSSHIPIIDYSMVNISYLSNHHCLYLPLYPRVYTSLLSIIPLYNVVMIGSPSSRRNHIWKRVIELFPDSHFITDNMFHPYQRMRYLLQHRVLLNIHYANDYKIWEELRCVPAVFHQMIVLSEDPAPSIDHPLSKYVVFTNYNNIVKELCHILSDFIAFKKRLYQDFDTNEIEMKYQNIYEAFQNEWSRLTLS